MQVADPARTGPVNPYPNSPNQLLSSPQLSKKVTGNAPEQVHPVIGQGHPPLSLRATSAHLCAYALRLTCSCCEKYEIGACPMFTVL